MSCLGAAWSSELVPHLPPPLQSPSLRSAGCKHFKVVHQGLSEHNPQLYACQKVSGQVDPSSCMRYTPKSWHFAIQTRMLGPGNPTYTSLQVSATPHTPLTASQPWLSSHLSRWFISSPPSSLAKLPWPIPSFSECELCWEMASWLLCDETHPGQSSGPFEQWWDAWVRVERGWHWQWCSGVIVNNLVVCWVWGVEELSHQFFEAFLFRVHFCCSPFQCPSWQLIGQCKGGGGSKLQFGRVVVTGVDPITIRQSLSTELVTAAL